MRRTLFIAAVAGLLAAGCSSDSAVQVGAPAGASDPDSTSSSVPEEPEGEGDEPIPGTRPVDAAVSVGPADALLAARDVTGAWQEPYDSDSAGYDAGPNQTDCDPYWVIETLIASPSASRFWFQPGANLDHEVFDTGPEAAAEVEAAVTDLPEACPLLTWLEGGTLAISRLPIDAPRAVALELISDGGEVWWSAYASRQNVVSRLQWVHFGSPGEQPPSEAYREFEQLVTVMVDRLDGAPAGPAAAVDRPPDVPPVETPPPVASTEPPPPDPDPVDDHALADLLLAAADLPQGVSVDETLTYLPGQPEDQRIAGCDASESVVIMDGWFAIQRSFLADDDRFEGLHIVGRASSADEAASVVETFGLIADCDPTLDVEFEQARLDGGPFDGITGATATYFEVEDQDLFTVRFVAYQVGDVVGVVALAVEAGTLPSIETHRLLTQSAVDRAGG